MSLTTDPNDPRLGHGADEKPRPQSPVYLVLDDLNDDELVKGFVRPVRTSYTHERCGTVTEIGAKIAGTYARNPKFYGVAYCAKCRTHRPVSEFIWDDGSMVGS